MIRTFGSLFAGIGGFDLGFHRAGFDCKWQVEIDDRAGVVLEARFPNTKRYKDVRNVGARNLEAVDVIAGGFPCQDLSVAGKRAGLAGERSGLWHQFHRTLAELRPRWAIVENVPGLLSSNSGRDFAIVLRGLVELGYGVSWRVLDSQFFGVPQRRRRVFIVGSLGDGRSAQVLFERESGGGDTATGREAGQGVAAAITGKPYADNEAQESRLIANTLGSHHGRNDLDSMGAYIAFDYCAQGSDRTFIHRKNGKAQMIAGRPDAIAFNNRQDPITSDVAQPLGAKDNGQGIAWHENQVGEIQFGDVTKALKANASHNYQGIGVRRLTPRECEHLQGFPDDFTLVDGASDSARYRQLGNAVTVSVAYWLALRILEASR